MTWLTTIPEPQRSDYPNMAEYMLDYDVFETLKAATTLYQLYLTPQDYASNLINYAYNLSINPLKLAPSGWNWALKGLLAVQKCFTYLSQIAVNAGDENSVDVLTAWQNRTSNLYGGHAPVTLVQRTNTTTGPQAVTVTSIFGIAK